VKQIIEPIFVGQAFVKMNMINVTGFYIIWNCYTFLADLFFLFFFGGEMMLNQRPA
jgi:hypothetical protein